MSLILRHLRANRRAFVLGFLCLAATSALTLYVPWLLKEAIEALRRGAPMRQVTLYAGLIAAVASVLCVIRTWSRLCILGASRRIVCDIRNEVHAHLIGGGARGRSCRSWSTTSCSSARCSVPAS